MPILQPQTQDDIVHGLRVTQDGHGRQCLAWESVGHATSYIACYSVVRQGSCAGELRAALTDADLGILAGGGRREVSLASGAHLALQGITRAAFDQCPHVDASGELGNWARVWCATESFGAVSLYVPDAADDQVCCIPQRFGFEATRIKSRRKPTLTHLVVTLENPKCYSDGDLQYRVGNLHAIPLPAALVESGFDIRIESDSLPVVVEPSAGQEERYRRF